MFVWIFHRISGILLVFVLSFQLFTGFFQAISGSSNAELIKLVDPVRPAVDAMATLHKHTALNCLLVFLVIFHALYGFRTILMDLGVRKEKLLFWVCTALGLILFVVFLILFLTLVAA